MMRLVIWDAIEPIMTSLLCFLITLFKRKSEIGPDTCLVVRLLKSFHKSPMFALETTTGPENWWPLPRTLSRYLLILSNHYNQFVDQGPVSISDKTSCCKISRSPEAARLVVQIITSLWNLTGISAALLSMCLSNVRAIVHFEIQIVWPRDFASSYNKSSYRILKRGPGTSRWMAPSNWTI